MTMVEVLFLKTGILRVVGLQERRGQEMEAQARDCCMNGIQLSITQGGVIVIESKPLVAAQSMQYLQVKYRQLVISN